MFSALAQDVTFAARQFRRNSIFTVTVVLTLAVGIAATTTIFSLVDGVLLWPLPFPNPDRLLAIDRLEVPPGVVPMNLAAANEIGSSYPNFFEWQQQNHTFDSLSSYDLVPRLFSKKDGEGARVMTAARVSANLFFTLGVNPVLGRAFLRDEEQAGHRPLRTESNPSAAPSCDEGRG